MEIFELNNKAQSWNLQDELDKAIKEAEPEIVEANQEQMYAGFKSDGSNIEPDYAPFTVKKKKEKGHIYDHVTLKDKGDFYKLMKVEDRKVISTDEKFKSLTVKYDESIMGLDEIDIDKITENKLNPFLTNSLQNAIS